MQTNSTVTIINHVQTADIWLLPETQANLKTTLWGTATAAGVQTGENRQIPLCEPGENGCFILRMIDTQEFYYSANSLALSEGDCLEINCENVQLVTLTITDKNGEIKQTCDVFSARL